MQRESVSALVEEPASSSNTTTTTAQPAAAEHDVDSEIRGYAPDDDEEEEDEGSDLPPGRIHATRSTSAIRLKGNRHSIGHVSLPNLPSSANSSVGGGSDNNSVSSTGSASSDPQSQRRNSSTPNMTPHHLHHHHHHHHLHGSAQRSKSPSFQLQQRTGGGSTTATAAATTDGNSSISSLEDLVDSDILYDRAGALIQDLDVLSNSNSNSSLDGSKSGRGGKGSHTLTNSLPSVNERLSDETMEDVHAFSDVKVMSSSSNASRANSLTDAGDEKVALDPLEECDDEDADSLEDPSVSSEMITPATVILTNIENLSLQAQQNVVAANNNNNNNTTTANPNPNEEAPADPSQAAAEASAPAPPTTS